MSLVEWADNHRYLSPEASSTPGKWNTDLVEAARGPMMAVTEEGVSKITVMGPTQMLKTELLNNIAGYFIHQDPSPIVVMQPTDKLCSTWATDRLEPMIRDTPVLSNLIAPKSERDSGNTKLHKLFAGGHITVVSAGSPSDVASRPVRVVLMDEVDKYRSSGSEGDPEKLIEQRQDTFWNSLSVAVCSPTLEGSSKIAARFEQSDQRLFHGLCPHCNEFEHLKWARVKWQKSKPETAHYSCSNCKAKWTESDRLKAIKKGKYIATKPFNGHAGFHVNAIASPWQTLEKLVNKWLDAQGDAEKIKVFINTSLAETFKPLVEVPDYMRLYERRETYSPQTISSSDVLFLTMGVDVQGDRLEAQIVGWTKTKESYIVDYIKIMGETHTDEPWNKLKEIINTKKYKRVDGADLDIKFTCIDSGFNTSKVYDFVTQFSQNKVRAIKGQDNLLTIFKMGAPIDLGLTGRSSRFGHHVWMVGSSILKEQLYSNLKITSKINEDGTYQSGFVHIGEFDEEYFKGLVSEGLEKTKTGYKWVKTYPLNEPLDTYNYARAAASMYGLDRFRETEWQQLRQINNQVQTQSNPIQQKKSKPKKANSNSSLWKHNVLKPR